MHELLFEEVGIHLAKARCFVQYDGQSSDRSGISVVPKDNLRNLKSSSISQVCKRVLNALILL